MTTPRSKKSGGRRHRKAGAASSSKEARRLRLVPAGDTSSESPATRETPETPETGAPDHDQVIMIIRHAEKPLPKARARGITSSGRPDKRSLTVDGWKRAGALVELLAPAWGEPPDGLRRPDAVYGSAAPRGRSKRSIQTVEPLAEQIGVDVVDRFAPGQEAKLAAELAARPGTTLVSWHHGSVSKIVKHLGEVTPAPPRHWPDDRFDVVWTLTRRGDGWRFEQVPQMLLPGDDPEPIAG